MTKFLHWRKTTWALLLWSGYLATWMVLTGSGPAIVARVVARRPRPVAADHATAAPNGRIQPSRRHGPFDPRFNQRSNPTLPLDDGTTS